MMSSIIEAVIGMHGVPAQTTLGNIDGIFVTPFEMATIERARTMGLQVRTDKPALWVTDEVAEARNEGERIVIHGRDYDIVHILPNGYGATELVLVLADDGAQEGSAWR
jgi:hypothetical protein